MVSVIIPTYKRAEYIERAIKSVLNQTYQNFEIIVVDDNNPNTTERSELEEKMKKFSTNDKIIFIQHEVNKNGAAARNTGIKIARGDYITFLDDDDYFLSDRLSKMVQALENNKEYGAAYSSAILMKNSNILSIIEANKSGNFQKDLLMQKSFFGTGSNMFFRADILKKLNGFDEKFLRHQDIEVMIRFFNENKILAVKDILVVKNDDDRKNIPNIEKMINIKKLFFDTFEKEINKIEKLEREDVFYYNYREVYIACIRSKQFKEAKKIKKVMSNFKKISFKENIKYLWILLNAYIPINKIKQNMNSKKYKKGLDIKTLNEINICEKLK